MAAKKARPVGGDGGGGGGLKIIHASLFRMGTKSMATAYNMLGFKTHHGLLENVFTTPYILLEQAAEATFPMPGMKNRPPFTRADWDRLWGEYDAVTDLASPFVPALIKAYPEAKVVVVQRDFEAWWPSMWSQVIDFNTWQPVCTIVGAISWYILGFRGVQSVRRIIFGFFNARSRQELLEVDRARTAYDRYFREIRSLVPPERRLEYKLGDGWEPLCRFLEVEEPNAPFPRVNDRAEHEREKWRKMRMILGSAAKLVLPLALALVLIMASYRG